MSYTAPTASDIKTRFAPLANLDDAVITPVIAEAMREVDTSWTEGDYANAIMYLTAHMLVAEGAIDEAGGVPRASTPGPVKSESLGDSSVTYGDRGGSSSMSAEDAELSSTVYGQRFMKIRARNVGGPILL